MFGTNEEIEIRGEEGSGTFSTSLLPEPRFPWGGLAGSLVVHSLLIPVLALGFQHVTRMFPDDEPITVSSFQNPRVYMLKLPADLLEKPTPPKKTPQEKAVAEAKPKKTPLPPKPVESAPAKAAPRPFTMPTESVAQKAAPVILQPPDIQVQATKLPVVELPTITMVAPTPPKARKVFDVGSIQKQRAMPVIPEPGLLPEPPPMMVSTIPIRPLPTGVINPKLPVYTAPPPLQTIEAKDTSTMSSGGTVVASPANLVMSSPNPIPAKETVSVPAAIALPQGGNGSAPSGTAQGSASVQAGKVNGREGRSSDTDGTEGKAAAGSAGGTGNAPSKVESVSGNGVIKAVARTSADIRIVHPSNGLHEFTIVQSGVDHILPAVRGLLEGDPVYTVYLNVGWTKEWIMHFCVPREGPPPPRQVGGVISLSSPPALKPPFPLITLAPQQKVAAAVVAPVGVFVAKKKPILIHGYLEGKGTFSKMKMHENDESGLGDKVLSALDDWQLRPATRGGSPVRIQVILVIPVQ